MFSPRRDKLICFEVRPLGYLTIGVCVEGVCLVQGFVQRRDRRTEAGQVLRLAQGPGWQRNGEAHERDRTTIQARAIGQPRPKAEDVIRELARSHTAEVFERLMDIC